jgi:hypothetical protein
LAPVCNFSNRPILVGGSAGLGHGHDRDRSKDRWAETILRPGQCISAWEPRKVRLPSGEDCWLADIDAIDLNGDGMVRWPGTRGFGRKVWEYTAGEAFRGSDTASGPFWPNPRRPAVENQFVVLRTIPINRTISTFQMLGSGRHSR